MEFLIIAFVTIAAIAVVMFYIAFDKRKREEVVYKVEISVSDLKKMTKAKLGVFIAEHNLDIDLKQKKDDIIAEIKKKL